MVVVVSAVVEAVEVASMIVGAVIVAVDVSSSLEVVWETMVVHVERVEEEIGE